MRLDRVLTAALVLSAASLLLVATIAGAQGQPDVTDGTSVNYVPPAGPVASSAVPTVSGSSLGLDLFLATLRCPAVTGAASIAFTPSWPWFQRMSPGAVREPAAVRARRPASWITRAPGR